MLTRSARLALVDRYDSELPVYMQAELLQLNRSSIYYKPVEPSQQEIQVKNAIDEIYTQYPFYGSRRITETLRRKGFVIGRAAVQSHMREMGIEGICPGPNLSRRNSQHRVYPYLLRGLKITRSNQVWSTDITYIRLSKGWMYLMAIIDWHSRYIVEWALNDTLEAGFVVDAVACAVDRICPEIMNSDQGSQFTCDEYISVLQAAGAKISMDGKGRALDNIMIERFWRSLKYEEVYLNDYTSPREARTGISRYIELYNYDRPHSSLDYYTPYEIYSQAGATRIASV